MTLEILCDVANLCNFKSKGEVGGKKIGKCSTLVITSFHPAFLMRQPEQKKMAWIDLKMIKKKIDDFKIKIEK